METTDASRELEAMYPALRRFAAVVAPSDVEPDDVVQEAFVRALRRGLDDIDDLPAYLRRIVVNVSSTSRRAFVRRQSAYARVGPDVDVVAFESALETDLDRLEPELRAVLWLAEVEGRPYSEIARLLGCSEDAARARASRARRRLRLELLQEER